MSILSNRKILAISFAALAFPFPREANASMKPIELVDPVPSPTLFPTFQPSLFEASIVKANFRQEFLVDDASAFGDDVVATLELLYATYTVEYSPDSDAWRRISTNCTVERQTVLTVDPDAIPDETDDHLLIVDFTVTFSSPYYDVTSYPLLFQDWTDSNLDVMLRDVQGLRTDVNTLDKPKRIVVTAMTDSTTDSTTDPTSVSANSPPSPAPTTSSPAPSIGKTAVPSRSPTAADNMTSSSSIDLLNLVLILALILITIAVVSAIFAVQSKLPSRSKGASKTSDPENNQTDDDSVDDPMADDLERGQSDANDVDTGENRADAALSDFSFGKMQSINLD